MFVIAELKHLGDANDNQMAAIRELRELIALLDQKLDVVTIDVERVKTKLFVWAGIASFLMGTAGALLVKAF